MRLRVTNAFRQSVRWGQADTRRACQMATWRHQCLSAVSPLGTSASSPSCPLTRWVTNAFRQSVRWGQAAKAAADKAKAAKSPMPFGSQSAGDGNTLIKVTVAAGSSPMPFGSQSAGDDGVGLALHRFDRQVTNAFRQSVRWGHGNGGRGGRHCRRSPMPFGSQSAGDDRSA